MKVSELEVGVCLFRFFLEEEGMERIGGGGNLMFMRGTYNI